MLTLFTIPKPFVGHIDVIQRNALLSWRELGEGFDAIVFGDDPGVADAAADLGLTHVPDVARNEFGTPLLSDLFAQAHQRSDSPLLGYVNADIVLLDDFVAAVRRLRRQRKRFLMVGQRTDLDITEPFDPAGAWRRLLLERAETQGRLRPPPWIDYFIFRRGMWGAMPPFAVGRTAFDNWLIYRARQLKIPVVDATPAVTAIHQNHDYSHTGNGYKGAWSGVEARRNYLLAGGKKHLFTIWDSTHLLTPAGLVPREHCGLGGGIWSYRRSVGRAI